MSTPALDPDTVAGLLESVDGDREFLGELFSAFTEEAPGLLATIEASVASGDADALRHAAHTLKSTSASLGALGLSEVSRDLEQLGRSGDPAAAAERLAEVRELVGQALAAMAAEVAEG